MRTIDAEALKENVALMWGDNSHITESMNEIIDNVPTVERPQGEWIEKRDANGCIQLYCNQCGTKAQVGSISFCGKCGANMKGKEE